MKHSLKYLVIFILGLLISIQTYAQYDLDMFFLRGRQAFSDGKYARSIENFNVIAKLDTTNYWNYFYRGIAKYNLGDIRGAYSDFDKSVSINPIFTSGYHYRAIARSRFGDYDKALEDLQTAIELRPGFEGLYYSRGVTYFLARQFDNAVKDFDKYIHKQPKDPSAYLNRGASYLFLGDTLKALNDYNKAISLDEYEPEGFVRRGRLYAMQNNYDKAIEDMNRAVKLDSANTFAYFNRALMYYEKKNYNAAMADLNMVLKNEPGNALTLYNRSLIYAQVGEFEHALDDIDRVININPKNVLAYYNRASYFMQMSRWEDAISDYDKAISLYPDFAKAYMNRSYAKNMLGRMADSKKDYDTAQRKIKEYRAKTSSSAADFADTTKQYSSLLAFDAEFAKKDFDDELLQNRDIDIRLRPMQKFILASESSNIRYALNNKYENGRLDAFIASSPVDIKVGNKDSLSNAKLSEVESIIYGDTGLFAAKNNNASPSVGYFLRGVYEAYQRQFNSALAYYDKAVEAERKESVDKAFFLMNRAVLKAEMVDFINSIENNVQTLTMDDKGSIRARVKDKVNQTYDYSESLRDMEEAEKILPDNPYIVYDLANLYSLSSRHVEAIDKYTKAIELYQYMGDAYFNRGLVQIYLKDKEKGCIDLSKAGELGIKEAYGVINRYCENKTE